ncbi:MAG: hypothetical protein IIA90_00690 [Chloroflexi bacterium]|nr:hypothetical protein [Chloroflexota bacterium]
MRTLPFVLVLTAGVLLGTMIGCGSSAGDDPSDEIRIEGLSTADIVEAGILLKVPAEEPAFDANHAAEVALEKHPRARIRQVVLARIRGEGLAWVVNFDPDSIEPPPPLGYAGPIVTKADGRPDYGEVEWSLLFVNAKTGEYTGGLTASSGWEPPD